MLQITLNPSTKDDLAKHLAKIGIRPKKQNIAESLVKHGLLPKKLKNLSDLSFRKKNTDK